MRPVVFPLLLAVLMLAELLVAGVLTDDGSRGWIAAVTLCLSCVILTLRRRLPFLAPTLAGLTALTLPWSGTLLRDIATPILLLATVSFLLGRALRDLRGLLGVAALIALALADMIVVDPRPEAPWDIALVLAIVLPAYGFGRVVHRLDVTSRRLEDQQAVIMRQAAQAERDRIARDMHDVVLHSISAMVVQVTAARDLLSRHPVRVGVIIDRVTRVGREALEESGRMLHDLHQDRPTGDELPVPPAPVAGTGWWRNATVRRAVAPAAIAVIGTVELLVMAPLTDVIAVQRGGWMAAIALLWIACAALLGSESRPLLAPTLAGVLTGIPTLFGEGLEEPVAPVLVLMVATFALARHLPDLRGLLGVALITASALLFTWVEGGRAVPVSELLALLAFGLVLLSPAYVFGRVVRRLDVTNQLLVAQQEVIRQQAARAERDRIARDMHDVVAHSISAMVVQATAARDLLERDPERAGAVLDRVAGLGRDALEEAGRMVQANHQQPGITPVPGLADLPGLIVQMRDAGLDVTWEVEVRRRLPVSVDLTSYRVLREALTNALRYSADRTARLSVRCEDDVIALEVSNPASGRTGAGSGLGLVGVRQRVEQLQGGLDHGLNASGEYTLAASLPVEAATP